MQHTDKLKKMKAEFVESGTFLIDGGEGADECLDAILPGLKYLGYMTDILGYEPDNYRLLGAYEFGDKIVNSFDAGNQWVGFGLLDESNEEDAKFATEIRAGVERLQKKTSTMEATLFDEEGSLNDMHDPINWVNHTVLDSMKKTLSEEGYFVVDTSIDSRNYLFCMVGYSNYYPKCQVLESAAGYFRVSDIGNRKLHYHFVDSESQIEIAMGEAKLEDSSTSPFSQQNESTPYDYMTPEYIQFQPHHPKHKLDRTKVLEAQLAYAREAQFVIPLDIYMEVYLEEILPNWIHLGHVNDIVGFKYYAKHEIFHHLYFYEGALVISSNCKDDKDIMFRKLDKSDMVLSTIQKKIAKRLFTSYAPS